MTGIPLYTDLPLSAGILLSVEIPLYGHPSHV